MSQEAVISSPSYFPLPVTRCSLTAMKWRLAQSAAKSGNTQVQKSQAAEDLANPRTELFEEKPLNQSLFTADILWAAIQGTAS